jgi:dihydroneopterin aldolase
LLYEPSPHNSRCSRAGPRVNVELSGLEVYGFHGVLAEERKHGQRFLIDVAVVPLEDLAAGTDDIRDAVDYRTIVAVVQEISGGHTFHLLEAFCTAVADGLLARLPISSATVTVRKPDVVLDLPVRHAAVTVGRYRETESE